MAITRWEPITERMSLRQMMDRLMEDAWVMRPWGSVPVAGAGGGTFPLDLYETDDDIVVTATLPGIKPEDVDITVQGDVLRIHGETKDDEKVGEAQFHRRERSYGRFDREVALPVGVKSDAAQAHFEHGVPTLHLPKAAEAKPHRIPIQGATSPQLESRAA